MSRSAKKYNSRSKPKKHSKIKGVYETNTAPILNSAAKSNVKKSDK
jgi:hypothetical protein